MDYFGVVCLIAIILIAMMASIIIYEIEKRRTAELEIDELKAELRIKDMCERSATMILDPEREDRIIKNTNVIDYDDLLNMAFEMSAEELLEEAKTNKDLREYLEGRLNGN